MKSKASEITRRHYQQWYRHQSQHTNADRARRSKRNKRAKASKARNRK